MEIDYSGIKEVQTVTPSTWRPPRHVYFGKKDPNTGMMEEEPQYIHQDYPRMIYLKKEDRIVADVVADEVTYAAKKAEGWVDSPAAYGIITCPSFEQWKAMQEAKEQVPAAQETKKAAETVAANTDLVAQYTAKFGKPPHWKMSAKTIAEKVAA